MRIIAILLLSALTFNASAQKKSEIAWPALDVDAKTKLITYSGVPEVGGVAQGELYDRAYDWVKDYYKNYAEKLRKSERDAGELEIFARFPIYAYDKKGVKTNSSQGLVQYTLKIMFKDGRYKYELSGLNLKATSLVPLEKWLDKEDADAVNHAAYLTDVDNELKAVIASMKDAIATPKKTGGDDW